MTRRIWPREISKSSSTSSCLGLAAAWFRQCLEKHAICREFIGDDSPLPSRVIDVGDDHGGAMRLVVTGDARGRYAALSYCWGQGKNLKLTTQNLEEFRDRIEESLLPPTVQDAVRVTRATGLRYLWVDALCIVQDSREDWIREAAKMGNVYSCASFTVFATAATSADQGFLTEREERSHGPICSVPLTAQPADPGEGMTPRGYTEVFLRPERPYNKGFSGFDGRGRWSSRGWTLQEYVSAGRDLSFDDYQMGWRCLTEIAKEDGGVQDQLAGQREFVKERSSGIIGRYPGEFADTWSALLRMRSRVGDLTDELYDALLMSNYYHIVNELGKRHFSFRSDLLPAIAAIAMDVERGMSGRGRYWAGLWDNFTAFGLLWSVRSYDNDDYHQTPSSKHSEWTPSWSWASVVECVCDDTVTSPHAILQHSSGSRLRDVRFPDHLTDQERLIPTASLPLVFTAPYCRLPTDWVMGVSRTKTRYPYLVPFEEQLHYNIALGNDRAEFGQKHRAHPSQHFAAVQVLTWMKPTKQRRGAAIPISTTRLIIIESVSEDRHEYRRVSDLEVLTRQVEELGDPIHWEERELTLI